jgi:hypothetical protein
METRFKHGALERSPTKQDPALSGVNGCKWIDHENSHDRKEDEETCKDFFHMAIS